MRPRGESGSILSSRYVGHAVRHSPQWMHVFSSRRSGASFVSNQECAGAATGGVVLTRPRITDVPGALVVSARTLVASLPVLVNRGWPARADRTTLRASPEAHRSPRHAHG